MDTALEALVEALESAPAMPVRRLDVLPASERAQIERWNSTRSEFPGARCIHELFEAQVPRSPDAVAVVYEDGQLTYAELNARANRLAHHLRGLGVTPGARVGICVERSLDLVVGLLGILKSGGAYVPLDPAYPAERLFYMLSDSAPRVVVTHAAVPESVRSQLRGAMGVTGVLELDDVPAMRVHAARPSCDVDRNPDLAGLTARDLAYVIYTSGSTGQ